MVILRISVFGMIWSRVGFVAKIGVFARYNGRFRDKLIMKGIEVIPSYCDTH